MTSLRTDGANKKHVKATKKIGFLNDAAEYTVKHQIGLSICILAILTLDYLFFSGTGKFFFLQHGDPKTSLYKKGKDDAYFIFTWVVLFTLLRAAIMEYILMPIAKLSGIKKVFQQTRFAEQGWSFLYYSIFWTLGMYLMSKSPHWFDTTYFWKDYPHIEMSGLFKWYYLVQLAFWIQQVFVINIEKRRKDYFEMLAHHAVTILLISFSYSTNWTRIGNAILCTMDFTDIILPFAKMLKYCGFEKACDISFGFLMISWVVTRHFFFGYIVYSLWIESRQYMELKWVPEEEYYFSANVKGIYLSLLISLQALIYFWFYLICRVAYRVVKGDSAHDNRSDSEGSEGDEVAEEKVNLTEEKKKNE